MLRFYLLWYNRVSAFDDFIISNSRPSRYLVGATPVGMKYLYKLMWRCVLGLVCYYRYLCIVRRISAVAKPRARICIFPVEDARHPTLRPIVLGTCCLHLWALSVSFVLQCKDTTVHDTLINVALSFEAPFNVPFLRAASLGNRALSFLVRKTLRCIRCTRF